MVASFVIRASFCGCLDKTLHNSNNSKMIIKIINKINKKNKIEIICKLTP